MRDTGPDKAKSSIETHARQIPGRTTAARCRRSTTKVPAVLDEPGPVRCPAGEQPGNGGWPEPSRSPTSKWRRRPPDASVTLSDRAGRIDRSLFPPHIELAANCERSCPANPPNRNPRTTCRRRKQASRRQIGPLPEARPSAAEDIAAFVAKARAMSPHASRRQGQAGICARRHHEPAADLGHGLRAAGRHVSRGGVARQPRYPPGLLSRPQ